MTEEAYEVYAEARRRVAEQSEGLHGLPEIANAQVIEYLAADYLAGLQGCYLQPPKDDLSGFPGNWKKPG